MKKINLALILSGCFFSLVALAQGVPVPQPSVVPGFISGIQNFASSMPMTFGATITTIIGFIIEMLVRFIPTAQPRSLLILGSMLFKGVSDILLKASSLLDQIVQNIKQ